MSDTTLFSEYDLAGLSLPNRVVMAPMTRSRNADTIPNDATALYYSQRAGAGLIVSEGSQVSPRGVGYLFTPGIHSPQQIDGWKNVTQAVHAKGGRIFCQIWHVGRVSHTSLHSDNAAPVSSSAKRAEGVQSFAYDEHGNPGQMPASTPVPLKTNEVEAVVEEYAQAAANAIDAGFNGVEIHGANGYLIEQFINAGINDRQDQYTGQTIEGRLRFALEVVDAVTRRVGSVRVGIRIAPFNRGFDMPSFDGEEETWIALANELSRRGLAYVHISNRDAILASNDGAGFLRRFRQAYKGTLILAGQYTQEKAESDLREGLTDLVAFGRPFISNPDLVNRMKNGWPLTPFDPATFYGGGAAGYTDYTPYADQS